MGNKTVLFMRAWRRRSKTGLAISCDSGRTFTCATMAMEGDIVLRVVVVYVHNAVFV